MQDDNELERTIALDVASAPAGVTTPLGQRRVADRYEILGLLGSGGMGNVYKVRDSMLDEVIALKTLHRELAADPMALARFRREVKLARRVTHPNVARTFDIGVDGEVPYLTMEFISGEPLHAHIHQEGGLPLARSLEIVTHIAQGLAAAHEAGVIHRDLKPPNIMIAGDRVVITDFGIARVARRADTLNTAVGGMIGTPTYMAPEQVEGTAEIDHRADIYALGVMLYELVTGRAPWSGDSLVSIALARLLRPPPRLETPGIPAALEDVVARSLARHARDRYPDLSELIEALSTIRGQLITGQGARVPSAAPLPISNATSHPSDPQGRTSVVVLPMNNRAGADDAYLADGLTEELVGELSMAPRLRVKPASAAASMEGGALEIGRSLGVDVVVEGSMRRVGDALRVRLALISVGEGFQIWGKKFRCAPTDVLDLAEEAAEEVARALVTDVEDRRPAALTDPLAIDLYMRGRHAIQSGWMTDMTPACELLGRALERAPDDPRVLTGLAAATARAMFFEPERGDALLTSARAYATRAVELAPEWPDPHYALAMTSYAVADFAATIRECHLALALAPEHVEANDLLGRVLAEVGPLSESLVYIDRALGLNESLYQTQNDKLRVLALLGRWEEADVLFESLSGRIDSTAHRALRLRFAGWRERFEWLPAWDGMSFGEGTETFLETLRILMKSRYLTPEQLQRLRASVRVLAPGQRTRLIYQLMVEFALISGERELALLYLEEALEIGVRDLMWLTHCPLMQKFDEDPRFLGLRRGLHDRLLGSGTLSR